MCVYICLLPLDGVEIQLGKKGPPSENVVVQRTVGEVCGARPTYRHDTLARSQALPWEFLIQGLSLTMTT